MFTGVLGESALGEFVLGGWEEESPTPESGGISLSGFILNINRPGKITNESRPGVLLNVKRPGVVETKG